MEPRVKSLGDLPAVVAIAATYGYFLLFDQFAFLDLLQAALPAAGAQAAMALMGVTGLTASLVVAALLHRGRGARGLMLAGFALAAVTAAWAPGLGGSALIAAAAPVGLATALVTVPLAAALRQLLGSAAGQGRRFGLRVGLGTGLAYFFCNLPPVFAGSPALRSQIAAAVALAGFLAAWRFAPHPAPAPSGPAGPALKEADARGFGLASLVISFLALIWLDSAAFAVIQESAGLKGVTWGSGGATLLLGSVHLAAALLAGWWIDAGYFRSLLLAAFALFAAALGLLGAAPAGGLAAAMALAGPLYAAAVSLYSVALVAFPAYSAEAAGRFSRPWRAGLVFGIAGWLGSALGVGMAQDLHRVPPAFLVVAGGLLVLAAWLARRPAALRPGWRELLEVHGTTLFFLFAAIVFFGLDGHSAAAPPAPLAASRDAGAAAIARGRQVYIAEGCIYCHSQFVRPGTRDEALWGPHRDLDRAKEKPPLIGLRRQGPDLSNVGRRRDAARLELQLREPRAIDTFSSMPSYAHLFAAGDSRGEDLVAYLESLR